jgi:hypothetical protein
MPDLLVYQAKGEKVYIPKSKLITYALRQLKGFSAQAKRQVVNRWAAILKNYQVETAMQSDEDFERLLQYILHESSPVFSAIMANTLTFLVQEEMARQGKLAKNFRLFDERGLPLSLRSLTSLDRRDVRHSATLVLPFWYTIPIISNILGFMKRGHNKVIKTLATSDGSGAFKAAPGGGQDGKLIVLQYQKELIPQGFSVESFLRAQEAKWPKLLNESALRSLKEDIQSLVKARLRQYLKLKALKNITRQDIDDLALSIYEDTEALEKLGSRDAMTLYVKVLIFKYILTL